MGLERVELLGLGSDVDLAVLQAFFSRLQEAVLAEPWIYLAWRPGPGRWNRTCASVWPVRGWISYPVF